MTRQILIIFYQKFTNYCNDFAYGSVINVDLDRLIIQIFVCGLIEAEDDLQGNASMELVTNKDIENHLEVKR